MVLTRSYDPRAGWRAGLAVGALGLALLASAFALEIHAAQGAQAAAGAHHPVEGLTHIVGAVDPGTDSGEAATCTISTDGVSETVQVGLRQEAFEAIRVGRRVHVDQPATLRCDHRVIVVTGPTVYAYPLAGHALLYPAYAVVALLGFAYARRRAKPGPVAASPLRSGDDGNRADMRRFAVEVARRLVAVAAGIALILLGAVSVLMLVDGSPAGLLMAAVVAIVGVVRYVIGRRLHAKPGVKDSGA